MADVKWSDDTAFPEAASINGTEEIMGLKSGNNMKANVANKLLPYMNTNVQLPSTSKVTGLDGALAAKMDKSANLSDVGNRSTSTGNLGLGIEGLAVLISNTDLENPCARKYLLNSSSPFEVKLPPAQSATDEPAIQVGWEIEFVNEGSATVTISDLNGTNLTTLDNLEDKSFVLAANGTLQGTWVVRDNFSTPAVVEALNLISSDDTVDITTSVDSQDFSAWKVLENNLLQGTNITIDKDIDAKTATVSASGTPFSVGAGADFNISSGATTTFSNSSPQKATFTVSSSSGTNMTIGSDGTLTCSATGAGKYNVIYSMAARSSSSQNVFYFYVAKNGSVDTKSLMPITVPTGPGNAGNPVIVADKLNLNPGDFINLYVANPGSLSNDLILQNMVCNCSLDLESSANLQSAYDNGNVIEGDQDASPFTINNSSGDPLLTFTETGGILIPIWDEVTGTSASMVANTNYIANNAGLVTLTLPTTCNVGDSVRVIGKGAGGWRIAQNSGQSVHLGNQTTTAGAGGYLESTNRYDNVTLICITANTEFTCREPVGNLTVV